jgi:hypothetical protein
VGSRIKASKIADTSQEFGMIIALGAYSPALTTSTINPSIGFVDLIVILYTPALAGPPPLVMVNGQVLGLEGSAKRAVIPIITQGIGFLVVAFVPQPKSAEAFPGWQAIIPG